MQFIDMTFSNFKAFRGTHYFDFRKYPPGLYFIRGENLVEPELGSNGASKSSLLDVLHWCLYGKSLRGTATPQLVSWQKEGNPDVSLRLRIDETITIRRTYRPTTLTITRRDKKETPVTQEQLEDIIGLTSDTFQSSIVIGQFSKPFFNLKPREKMSVFSELLDLDYWLSCSDYARDTLKVLQNDEDKHQRLIVRQDTLIEEVQRAIDIARVEEQTSVKTIKRETKKIKDKKKDLQLERKKIKHKINENRKSIKFIQKEVLELEEQERNLQHVVNGAKRKMSEYSSNIQVLNVKLSEHRKMERTLKTEKGVCPRCGQKITKVHRIKELERIKKAIEDTKASITANTKAENKWNASLNEDETKLSKVWKSRQSIESDKRTIENTIQKLEYEYENMNKELIRCDEKITELLNKSEADEVKIKKQEKRLAKIKTTQRQFKSELKELEGDLKQVHYWIKGFKDIRLYEIEETLASLKIEINSYLTELGMEGWTVSLNVERETKSGKISRGFQVMVDPGVGTHKSPRPWEVWSGGEGQRLSLAGTLALGNLILKQFNRESNLQFFDESMIWMSGSGREDLLELLQETAKREQKQIWIIDQNELSFSFDDTITIRKDKHGSHIVV